MAPLQEAAVQAVELENFAKGIPDLVPTFKTIYNLMKKGAKTYPTAVTTAAGGTTRPSFRIPWLSVNHTRLLRLSAVPMPVFALEVQRGGMPGAPGA